MKSASSLPENPTGGGSFRSSLRCSLLTDRCGYARRSRLGWNENPLPQARFSILRHALRKFRAEPGLGDLSRLIKMGHPAFGVAMPKFHGAFLEIQQPFHFNFFGRIGRRPDR